MLSGEEEKVRVGDVLEGSGRQTPVCFVQSPLLTQLRRKGGRPLKQFRAEDVARQAVVRRTQMGSDGARTGAFQSSAVTPALGTTRHLVPREWSSARDRFN